MKRLKNRVKVSKFLSFILRHKPESFNLKLDRNGFCFLQDILKILQDRFKDLDNDSLLELIKKDSKGRFEVTGDLIRARYGHSIEVVPIEDPSEPPEFLYHGTTPDKIIKILKFGLKPMNRQFVHLSITKEDAYKVGLRHTSRPVVLKILAKKVYRNNIKFFRESDVFLVRYIPPKFIIH
jgi:putative RNA 2'-phosphotransferase